MGKNIARAPVLRTVAVAALAFTAYGDSRKEETAAIKQESSVETRADEATKVGKSKMNKTTKAGETKADVSKRDNKTADAKESTMVDTLDEVKDFAFTLADGKGTACQFAFEQGKAPKDLSGVKVGDKVTVTYTGTTSGTNPFEGMIVSAKKT